MSESTLPERSLFAEVQEPVVDEHVDDTEEPMADEDREMILDLLDQRDRLRERIDELEEANMWKLLAMLAMSTLYVCIMIAVVDVKNNPEL